MKKIIMIGPVSPPLGGEAIAFISLTEYLKRLPNVQIVVIDKVYKLETKIRRYFNPMRLFLLLIVNLLQGARGVYLTLGQSYGGIIRDVIIIYFAKLFGVPMVIHLHGGAIKDLYQNAPWALRVLMKRAYHKVDKVIVLGKSLKDQFSFFLSSEKISVVPNSYSSDAPSAREVERAIDTRSRSSVLKLLYLSHVLPSKGLFDVLEGLKILKQQFSFPFEFHFAGAVIPEREYSESQIRHKISSYQDFFSSSEFIVDGVLDNKAKWDLLLKSHILLLPTRFSKEGQPISVVEAMYAGCAIITTRYRGIPDLVEDGANGWFVPPSSPEAIAQRILWVSQNRDTLYRMARLNHQRALTEFHSGIHFGAMETVFRDIFRFGRIESVLNSVL